MPEIVGRLRTPRLAAPPASPAEGEVYWNTTDDVLYVWNGTSWIAAGGGAASGPDLTYNGAFPTGGPSYTDGDIVVQNGVAYMCVVPTSEAPTDWPGGRGAGGRLPTPIVNGQWIKGQGGAAVWSPITAADVSGAEAQANKAQANGYASLDSGGKVPAAQLPALNTADLVYEGQWGAGTAYTDGDVVVDDGVAYMAVRPSTGSKPKAWPNPRGDGFWQAYTPSFNGTLGNAVMYGRYAQIGKTVFFAFNIDFGTTSAASASFQFGLPVPRRTTNLDFSIFGSGYAYNGSLTDVIFQGQPSNPNVFVMLYRIPGGYSFGSLGPGTPFPLADALQMWGQGFYEAA